ncbi:MAG TPA: response regulator transcription factor [Thermomicrobiales bacterium]|jgi:DNA-binding NarL/FixJ family response regulator|nr:response regulator transcription factor [Thermomicrobiales bacterium]
MLVDDHASLRRPLAFMIEREPDLTVVAEAGSLAEARAHLQAGISPDAVILDLNLPDGDGTDLIRDLRRVNPLANTLILSGVVDVRSRARAVAAGAGAVFPKTTEIEELIDAIRRMRQGEVLISPAEALELVRYAEQVGREDRIVAVGVAELTPREREILRALADGLSDKEIAERLYIGDKTVRNHVTSMLSKLGAESRLQALVIAIRHGVVRVE